jgi:hypothetical protein
MASNSDKNAKQPSKEEFSASVGAIIQQLGSLTRAEQLAVARMACGLVGGYLAFPGAQAPAGSGTKVPANRQGGPTSGASSSGQKTGKGPAKQAPTNPLAGSEAKKAYDAAKKAVSKSKANLKAGSEVPMNLINELARSKTEYFRLLGEKRTEATPAFAEVATSSSSTAQH